ncbi:hypothetical protein CK203_080063 [Vitis vinifera]|uniref:Uncharacterized protein n=1 Tax=Vitis vinifera TaxID=29760 RepID=A0A438D9U6_VITVI|nr:hypothetical protein CK203_080063 [Vitis vinifera]
MPSLLTFSNPFPPSIFTSAHRFSPPTRLHPLPTPPPESDPPPQNDPVPLTGLVATFSRFQDSIQIFFAVLFWLSLFFWASAWDGRNGGRPNKGSRLRR